MISCVPLSIHLPAVLGLLASNALLFFMAKRKVETLQMALVAKRALLRDTLEVRTGNYVIEVDEVLSMRDGKGGRMDITARGHRAILEITVV